MADFPEKETQETQDVCENSTVFSDPAEHKQVTVKKKKIWTKILAAVLCVAILTSGTVAVIKLIPVLEEESPSDLLQEITVKNVSSDDISDVTVTNDSGVTKFYSEESEEASGVDWYIESVDKDLTSSTDISGVIDAVTLITASREITAKSAEDCGLTEPAIKAVVNPAEGDAYTVLLGDLSPDNSGYYLKLSDSEKIYIVPTDTWDTLDFELLDFADTSIIPGFENTDGELDDYFSNDQLSKFDKVIIKGDNHPETVEIVRNQDEELSQYLGYIVNTPSTRIADNTDALLVLYQVGIEVLGAYSYDVEADTLKKFGLDIPDLELTMFVGEQSLTYKFALQEDGYYAAVYDDSKLIHKIDSSSLEGIIELSTTDYYSTWICYNSIDDLSNFTIKTESENYSFDIVKNETEDESSESQSSEEEEDYTITHNGKKLTALNFQYLYQYCVTLKCNDFVVEETSAEPTLTFVFNFKDGTDSVIEFTKVSATKYQYNVDGIDMGRVSASSINKVIKNVEKVSNGETISQLA